MFSNVLEPPDALARRLCSETAQGRVSLDPRLRVNRRVNGPRAGTFKEGTNTFIADT